MKKHRLLLDQMIDAEAADRLRAAGCDVVRTSDLGLATADDDKILACAIREKRLLVTLDEDFGDWVVLPLARHPGVIRVKAHPTTTTNILAMLSPLLARHQDREFADRLIIVKRSGIRWIRTGI